MKALLCGCAVMALWAGLADGVQAQVLVQTAPIHAVPPDDASQGGQAASMTPPLQASPAPPPAAVQVASVQAPAPAAPVLTSDEHAFFAAVGRHVTDAASAYASYVRQSTAIDPGFRDPDAVQHALRAGADYQPEQLQQGLVAYAALIALRDQAFVDGVRAADPALGDRLAVTPTAVLQIPGAQEAAADVMGVLRAHGVALQASGKAITQAAYDVQAQAWARAPVANPVDVLVAVKSSALHERTADETSEKQLLQSLVNTPRAPLASAAAPPQVVQGLALAALAVLGRTGDNNEQVVAMLLGDKFMIECLKLARMNLNQCLAAAGPHYDDVFCAGRHAVGETARCVSAASEGPPLTPAGDGGFASASLRNYGPEEAAAYADATPSSAADPAASAPRVTEASAAYDQSAIPADTGPTPYAQAFAAEPRSADEAGAGAP